MTDKTTNKAFYLWRGNAENTTENTTVLIKEDEHDKCMPTKSFQLLLCEICGKMVGEVNGASFDNGLPYIPSNFKRHIMSHNKDSIFECKICGKKLRNAKNLRWHEKNASHSWHPEMRKFMPRQQ
jgi:hypothetical protein